RRGHREAGLRRAGVSALRAPGREEPVSLQQPIPFDCCGPDCQAEMAHLRRDNAALREANDLLRLQVIESEKARAELVSRLQATGVRLGPVAVK
ncbi:MAG: hypothetical protein KGL39_58120, partial [Patescibacteria group bacterium]|nr:hypothetical protein [Patescibacteria group bacterium]